MSTIAAARLTEERKSWRKDHPPGFIAKPVKNEDDSLNIMKWEAGIPGPENTDWAGGVYTLMMEFPEDYPSKVCFLSSFFFFYFNNFIASKM